MEKKKCKFDLAWVGPCNREGYPFCEEHSKVRCRACGGQAVRECSIAVSLVCGHPLCKICKCPVHKE